MKMMSMTQIWSSVFLKWKLCNDIDVGSIERKQFDLCKRNIIFCHVDCFCLQERKEKEDEARSILCFQYFGDCLSKNELYKVLWITKCLPFSGFVVGK